MRIGIDCRLYSPSATGIGRYVAELVKNIAVLDQKNQYLLYFNQPDFDQFQIPNDRFEKKLANVPLYSMAEQMKWIFFLQKEPVDFFHFPHFNVPVFFRKPYVATIHDLTLHYFPYKSYAPKWSLKKSLEIMAYRFLMGKTIKNARHLIAVSQHTKTDIIKENMGASPKISVIYEGVPEEFQKMPKAVIDETKKKYGIEKPYLMYAGVMRSHKNILNLIRAFKTLINHKHHLQLVLVGKTDHAYPEIKKLISELSLTNRVIMTGFVSDQDMMALMSGASVFVFPSLYEGFGLPPLEAMRCGTPVACSNAASLPEILGDSALYFDPKNPDDIAEKIIQVVENGHLRQNLIMKGKKQEKKYSWNRMGKEILDIYNIVCNNIR